MTELLTISVFGVLISILGIINMTGNIASIHWYHRQRVSAENRKPFGKLVGLGTLIIGISLTARGILTFVSEQIQSGVLAITGNAVLIAGIIAGAVISFCAMKKYNGGVF